jgi:hypothetical protein
MELPSLAKTGSRERTAYVLDRFNEADGVVQDRINAQAQVVAQKLLDGPYATAARLADAGKRPKAQPTINALRIVAKGGVSALRQALADPAQLLPVLAAIGVGPLLSRARLGLGTTGSETESSQ